MRFLRILLRRMLLPHLEPAAEVAVVALVVARRVVALAEEVLVIVSLSVAALPGVAVGVGVQRE